MTKKCDGQIIILGGGPTGLGAAYQLHSEGYSDWLLFERDDTVGGLSRSFVDDHGFTWDIGGHVLFSHYDLFTRLVSDFLGDDGWLEHERECWIRICETWVPYPFQLNLRYLPPEHCAECLCGLIVAALNVSSQPFLNFDDYIIRTFGEGIANLFMRPYNKKVWAYSPDEMDAGWIGERVAVPDPVRVSRNIVLGVDDVAWGPNNRFRFPKRGGTGSIWTSIADKLPADKLKLTCAVVSVDVANKIVHLADGSTQRYSSLISTLPLTEFAKLTRNNEWIDESAQLRYSATHVVGLGLQGQPAADLRTKCWMYYPESTSPFYRVTNFSHYSPNNVFNNSNQWSLMAEVSESSQKPVDAAMVADEVIQGLIASGTIDSALQVTHTWHHRVEYGYPTPSCSRNAVLKRLLPALYAQNILSRGRFGAWQYEVGNMDHSFMQGVEAANHLLYGVPELTVWYPSIINQPHPVLGWKLYY